MEKQVTTPPMFQMGKLGPRVTGASQNTGGQIKFGVQNSQLSFRHSKEDSFHGPENRPLFLLFSKARAFALVSKVG